MNADSSVRVDDMGHVRVLVLNRPAQLNALNLDTLSTLAQHLAAAESDPNVRAIVLTGEGRAFSAGADIAEESQLSLGADDAWSVAAHKVIIAVHRSRMPTIAALNGLAVGAGLDLALACDIRIAAEGIWVSEGYVDIGYSPDAGATFLLPRLVGPARAAEMIFTGRRIDVRTALDWGLLSRVVPATELHDQALELAQQVADKAPVAVELAKRLLASNAGASLEDALRNELVAGRICGATEDHHEGVAALTERRKPVFRRR